MPIQSPVLHQRYSLLRRNQSSLHTDCILVTARPTPGPSHVTMTLLTDTHAVPQAQLLHPALHQPESLHCRLI